MQPRCKSRGIALVLLPVLLSACGGEVAEQAGLETRQHALVGSCNPAPCTRLFMSPGGSDTADGLSEASAVKTLARVHSLISTYGYLSSGHVQVHIGHGTYYGQTVTWLAPQTSSTYYLSFVPIDYTPGQTGYTDRPVFDGQGLEGYFFYLNAAAGRNTNVRWYYTKIQNYGLGGIAYAGAQAYTSTNWNGNNLVFGCYFSRIGNLWWPAQQFGYGGVTLRNSRSNRVENNHFINLENTPDAAGNMHGVYLAHYAHSNVITGNRFQYISGDPLRVRDMSNLNQFNSNVDLSRTGSSAFFSDWYCDQNTKGSTYCPTQECPSWKNEVKYNPMHCGYDGTSQPTFYYHHGERYDYSTADVPPGCTNGFASGWYRLATASNTNTCP